MQRLMNCFNKWLTFILHFNILKGGWFSNWWYFITAVTQVAVVTWLLVFTADLVSWELCALFLLHEWSQMFNASKRITQWTDPEASRLCERRQKCPAQVECLRNGCLWLQEYLQLHIYFYLLLNRKQQHIKFKIWVPMKRWNHGHFLA